MNHVEFENMAGYKILFAYWACVCQQQMAGIILFCANLDVLIYFTACPLARIVQHMPHWTVLFHSESEGIDLLASKSKNASVC